VSRESRIPNPESRVYACLHRPRASESAAADAATLTAIAEQFSPRYEVHGDDLVSIDVSGLAHLVGPPRLIGEELRRESMTRGVRAHVVVAGTRTAALVLALARPGLTVVPRGREAETLASVRVDMLETIDAPDRIGTAHGADRTSAARSRAAAAVAAFKKWGLKTLGEVAALPPADLVSRLGRPALAWQALARGEDIRPLVPTRAEERFESTQELEWPIEELEPLSFVLTRLLEPLSTRLERRDRGAAVLHVLLRLVTRDPAAAGARELYTRRLELPTPIRDVRTLRTLALLDLEAHPPSAAVDAVTIVIDPTPGRVIQHTLFRRAHPTPEQVSTLLARLGALMGQDRFGAAATVDSYRPGAFVLMPFATDHDDQRPSTELRAGRTRREHESQDPVGHPTRESRIPNPESRAANPDARIPSRESPLFSAVRRFRRPVPARVALADGRPVRVTTDRRGIAGGSVTHCAGPWRTSGQWWAPNASPGPSDPARDELRRMWNRDEWDVSLGDGAAYRIFADRETNGWFIDAIID
jgi:protein ImuB